MLFVRSSQARHRLGFAPSGNRLLAGGLALGLGVSAIGYAVVTDPTAATSVTGNAVEPQTNEPARTGAIDLSYRTATAVSRSDDRQAIVTTGLRTATQVESTTQAESTAQVESGAQVEAMRKKAATEAVAQQQAQVRRNAAAKQKAAAERARKAAIAGAKANPKAAARALMAAHGWTSKGEYRCLVKLWRGESDWRWYAKNPSSGALGIPQALPAGKMAQFGSDYRTNPLTQIKWGLWYIEQSYGSPCNALSFWQSKSPHWY